MKKIINICSYILSSLFIIGLIMNIIQSKGNKEPSLDTIKACILNNETANLPLKIQDFHNVDNILINDLVITNNMEPYTGYLVTEWDYTKEIHSKRNFSTREEKAHEIVYVEVNGIKKNGTSLEWVADWSKANTSVKKTIFE